MADKSAIKYIYFSTTEEYLFLTPTYKNLHANIFSDRMLVNILVCAIHFLIARLYITVLD